MPSTMKIGAFFLVAVSLMTPAAEAGMLECKAKLLAEKAARYLPCAWQWCDTVCTCPEAPDQTQRFPQVSCHVTGDCCDRCGANEHCFSMCSCGCTNCFGPGEASVLRGAANFTQQAAALASMVV
mmetsp:Transcript_104004/g.294668  ORF Transcript_104004/g.294668 Transcript_104004/m.294668 type:complete len:125 (-) Transcript_104004:91-465(-)